jgi:epidermal growth factor receptor substrate 15
LDVADFIVAMYFIRASMSGQLLFLPITLPPGLYEMASDQAKLPTGNSGPFSTSIPGNFFQNSSTPQLWDVTPTEKAIADKHFDKLDAQKRGYIDCDIVVPFMLQSNLPENVLASIWSAQLTYSFPLTSHTILRDLTDLNDDGHLTRDGFAIAFHLIQGKLAGKEIPTTLPASLIPPSMRVVTVPTPPFQQFPSDSLNDLVWEDSPVASHPQSMILQPQRTGFAHSSAISAPQTRGQRFFGMSRPPKRKRFTAEVSNKGLLDSDDDDESGDDDAAVDAFTSINDHSAEMRNLRNQFQSTTAALKNTRTERSNVEVTVRDQAAQLFSLQIRLSSAKATHGAESHLLATLRERFNNRSSEIQKVKEELLRAEGDLSAIRVEKAEVESNLLHSKEELYELKRKMTETYSTIKVVKAEVEKAKEETKQKEELLVVTKQHLAAREEDRAKLQDAVAEAGKATRKREVTEGERSHPPMTGFKPQEQWAGDREEKSEVQDSNEGR